LVDVAVIAPHVADLRARGLGDDQIGVVAGVSAWVVRAIRTGKSRRVRADTATKLLAVMSPPLALGRRIASSRTWRQIAWLHTEGFTYRAIAKRIGLAQWHLRPEANITVRLASRIDALFHAMHR